jgi:hypothetical protein
MLCINNYSKEYIDECRSKVYSLISDYEKLITTARKSADTNEALLNSAIGSFETNFFNNMVLVLDNYFYNRSRTIEMKDGNPLNEVRVLCNSMLNNGNKMVADKTIKLNPSRSVLKYKTGDEIKMREPDFLLLSNAFFAEIENKYARTPAKA